MWGCYRSLASSGCGTGGLPLPTSVCFPQGACMCGTLAASSLHTSTSQQNYPRICPLSLSVRAPICLAPANSLLCAHARGLRRRLLQVPHLGLLRCGPHARPRLPRGQPRVKVPWATWRELEEAAGTHVHAHMGVCDNCGNDSRPPPSPGSPLSTALFCLHLLCCDK